MTPLIDVVFLLLLFFMLASTFARFASLDLTLASEGARAAPAPASTVRTILVSVRPGAAFAIDGQPVAREEISGRLKALGDSAARVVVRPSADAVAGDVVGAVEAARSAGIGPVLLVH